MKKSLFLLFILTITIGCKQHSKFYLEGKVDGATTRVLYLEHNGITENTVVDSVKLSSDGSFSFKSARPEYPDFYRLRLADKYITFAVDSCETISIEAKADNFATDYVVTGSVESQQIQKLRISLIHIQTKVNEIKAEMKAEEQARRIAEIEKDIDVHKEMAKKLILENPRSLTAYFAIYQQVNNIYLFTPYLKADKVYCAAVATSFNTYMPDYDRTKNLYTYVIQAIKAERNVTEKQAWNQILSRASAGYIDITLPNKDNVINKLSSLEGKLVLIDFASYEVKESVDYIFTLRDIYAKYHSSGLEIYQISLDQNKALWLQAVQSIPWICVRDENGPKTKYVSSYNVSSIPTIFVLNKKGVIIGRYTKLSEVQRVIEKNI
ncbi:MAG: thioredoxin-like domain-containing protein [Paludibacter sp.]